MKFGTGRNERKLSGKSTSFAKVCQFAFLTLVLLRCLRDEVHRFEIKMKSFTHALEEGVDVVMWQLNRIADVSSPEADDFAVRATNITVRLHRRGDLFVQTVLTFNVRGGYLSKAIGRHRGGK